MSIDRGTENLFDTYAPDYTTDLLEAESIETLIQTVRSLPACAIENSWTKGEYDKAMQEFTFYLLDKLVPGSLPNAVETLTDWTSLDQEYIYGAEAARATLSGPELWGEISRLEAECTARFFEHKVRYNAQQG